MDGETRLLAGIDHTMRVLWISLEGKTPSGLEGFTIEQAASGMEGLERLKGSSFDAVCVAFPLESWEPEDLLEEIQRINSLIPVVVCDPRGGIEEAIRLTKLGAYYFSGSGAPGMPWNRLLETAVEYYRSRSLALFGSTMATEPWKRFLVGESRPMQNIAQLIRLIGARRCTVLITGETGVGKELVARSIHLSSNRLHLPMVAVNCHALPENLLEAELFGHVKGAFTGAFNNRVGRFEQANRSTIFLDEIGDMPLELQAKLLRVLQEREFQRLGSSETVRVDVRVIAATNNDLVEKIKAGKFREDLYYRLNVVPVRVPSLRERLADVPLLVHHFIDKICRQEEIPIKETAPETLARLARYDWPGNVRQLENAVEMAVALSGDRQRLYPSDFPLPGHELKRRTSPTCAPVISVPDDGLDFEATVDRIERAILTQALERSRGNKKQAADMLRLKRTTLSAKLRSLEAASV
jgi:DNA-binding NtrC family response regulator